ncbi:hypothetical protein [Magnetospira sp. QH-2]|uniref:hypothetical protein n=1 Tax=Magnetospira sp. (strain QH-2) TaxID=1288970 RepID=UPI0003E81BE5|nr:hypothetical protein [Magnetospira sp. QH-2]CCQ72336.1 protein of unknown function [Magnetospira sp. QH-2]
MQNFLIQDRLPEGIYIESRPAPAPFGLFYHHSYLTYRDGKGQVEVIRGGPNTRLAENGTIVVEAGIPLEHSKDAYAIGEDGASRGATKLNLAGREAKEVWQTMIEVARAVEALELGYDVTNEFILGEPMRNSNSVVAHVMEMSGVPVTFGVLPHGLTVEDLPGIENNLITFDPRAFSRSLRVGLRKKLSSSISC